MWLMPTGRGRLPYGSMAATVILVRTDFIGVIGPRTGSALPDTWSCGGGALPARPALRPCVEWLQRFQQGLAVRRECVAPLAAALDDGGRPQISEPGREHAGGHPV